MIFPVIEQNFLSREEISSHRKTGKQLMPQKDYCHHKKKFNPKEQNFKPQEEISYNREKFFFRKNFMSQEEIPFHSKKFPVTERIFLTQEEISIFIKRLNNQQIHAISGKILGLKKILPGSEKYISPRGPLPHVICN